MYTVRASSIVRFAVPLCLAVALALCRSTRACAESARSPYASIDAYALNAPGSVTTTADSLVRYLTAGNKTDLEKCRAIYRWITANIDYDASSRSGGTKRNVGADYVLKQRRTVCMGYSELFYILGTAAGLDVRRILGFGRGYAPVGGGSVCSTAPNHEWNAVRVDGKWLLIDCTWAAGHLEPGPRYVKQYDEFYFASPPEQFIFDHFPVDPDWQLLPKRISCGEWEELATVKPGFFRCGLEFASHRRSTIEATGPVEISLRADRDVVMLARLMNGDREVPGDYTFAERDGDLLRVHTTFPGPGNYKLRLFAKPKGTDGGCEWVAEYDIKVPSLSKPCQCFPESLSMFVERNAKLISPRQGRLKPGTSQTFKLSVPGGKVVVVVSGSEWTYLDRRNDLFEGSVTVTNHPMKVCVNYGDTRDYHVLLSYNTDPRPADSGVAGYQVELTEPAAARH